MSSCPRHQAAEEVVRARAEFHHNYLDYVSQLNDIHGKRKLDLLNMVFPRGMYPLVVVIWWFTLCGRYPRRGALGRRRCWSICTLSKPTFTTATTTSTTTTTT